MLRVGELTSSILQQRLRLPQFDLDHLIVLLQFVLFPKALVMVSRDQQPERPLGDLRKLVTPLHISLGDVSAPLASLELQRISRVPKLEGDSGLMDGLARFRVADHDGDVRPFGSVGPQGLPQRDGT